MPKLQTDFSRDPYREIMEKLRDSLEPISHEEYSMSKGGIDVNGISTIVKLSRRDGTLYKRSVLHGGVSPTYSTRTVTEYDSEGVVVSNYSYDLSYNLSQELIAETLIGGD